MICILSKTQDPFLNLASEEYLLKASVEDVFMLWQSQPTVISGKHQNILSEINYPFVLENQIKLARRLSGGGTVYHDSGNLNFTFIRNGEAGKLVNFPAFIRPVTDFLNTYNIRATVGEKHELLVNGCKISGNAEHVYKNRILHHGTLLVESDLSMLNEAIHHKGGTYTDKAVQSNRSRVINLREGMGADMHIEAMAEAFFAYMVKNYQGREYSFTESQLKAIEILANEKYRTWDWVFGWSPDYAFLNAYQTEKFRVSIEIKVHKGYIQWCLISSENIPPEILHEINLKLPGIAHRPELIFKSLVSAGIDKYMNHKEIEGLTFAFF